MLPGECGAQSYLLLRSVLQGGAGIVWVWSLLPVSGKETWKPRSRFSLMRVGAHYSRGDTVSAWPGMSGSVFLITMSVNISRDDSGCFLVYVSCPGGSGDP